MKKSVLIPALLIGSMVVMTSVSACSTQKGLIGKIRTVSKIANVVSTAQEIANVLGSTFSLSGEQESSVANIFTNYINSTNSIASLFNSNKALYLKKLTSLNRNTMGKIRGVFNALQYANLISLGGENPSVSSLISSLKGGKSLSSSSVSVLSGLFLNGVL